MPLGMSLWFLLSVVSGVTLCRRKTLPLLGCHRVPVTTHGLQTSSLENRLRLMKAQIWLPQNRGVP